MNKIKGIYKIENKVNGKTYIGESFDIERRWNEHREDLNNNKHHSFKLQNDWNKYGIDNFEFEILAEIEALNTVYKTNMQLIYLEGQYMNQYNALNDGYNIENTIEKILNGEKIIFKQPADSHYLKWVIKNGGIPTEKVSDAIKKKPKQKKKKEEKIKQEAMNCSKTYDKLINEGYIIKFERNEVHRILESKGIFKFVNNSFYVIDKYLEKGYFINGKKHKNKDGYEYSQIIITEIGKQFIIDLLQLQKL